MSDAWQVGRLFGIPLRIHISWVIVFGLVSWSLASAYFPAVLPDLPAWSYWIKAIVAALMLFASLILHELAHSLMAQRHQVPIAGITLFVFGGVSQMTEEPRAARQEFQIAIVGPLVSLVLAAVFALLAALTRTGPDPTALGALLTYLAGVNLLVAIFNMLPAFPLDGGRVLRAALWHFGGDLVKATRTAAVVGRGFAMALMGFGILRLLAGSFTGLWLVLIGWFILQAGGSSAAQASLRQALGGLRVRDVMTTDVKAVPAEASLGELVEDYLVRYTYGGYPVVKGGDVVGLVTLHELRGSSPEARATTPVERVMLPLDARLVVDADTPVFAALEQMVRAPSGRAVVLERGRLAGLVTVNGILHLAQVRSALGAGAR